MGFYIFFIVLLVTFPMPLQTLSTPLPFDSTKHSASSRRSPQDSRSLSPRTKVSRHSCDTEQRIAITLLLRDVSNWATDAFHSAKNPSETFSTFFHTEDFYGQRTVRARFDRIAWETATPVTEGRATVACDSFNRFCPDDEVQPGYWAQTFGQYNVIYLVLSPLLPFFDRRLCTPNPQLEDLPIEKNH